MTLTEHLEQESADLRSILSELRTALRVPDGEHIVVHAEKVAKLVNDFAGDHAIAEAARAWRKRPTRAALDDLEYVIDDLARPVVDAGLPAPTASIEGVDPALNDIAAKLNVVLTEEAKKIAEEIGGSTQQALSRQGFGAAPCEACSKPTPYSIEFAGQRARRCCGKFSCERWLQTAEGVCVRRSDMSWDHCAVCDLPSMSFFEAGDIKFPCCFSCARELNRHDGSGYVDHKQRKEKLRGLAAKSAARVGSSSANHQPRQEPIPPTSTEKVVCESGNGSSRGESSPQTSTNGATAYANAPLRGLRHALDRFQRAATTYLLNRLLDKTIWGSSR